MSEKKNEAEDEKTHPIAQKPATPKATELSDKALEQVSGGVGQMAVARTSKTKSADKAADAIHGYIRQ